MQTADFDYPLPGTLIAQHPLPERDGSRLLVLGRNQPTLLHRTIRDLPDLLQPGDLLVLNNTRVLNARLRGFNERTGGQFELLLLEAVAANDWWVMLRPGKRARPGSRIRIKDYTGQPSSWEAEVRAVNHEGHRRVVFHGGEDITLALDQLGEVPLPPYIERSAEDDLSKDVARYQTVYASDPGSVAAPTAGLHFTEALLQRITDAGVRRATVTLHVGAGTFAPVKASSVEDHVMHEERFILPSSTVEAIRETREGGGRVITVGTTTARVLESVAADHDGNLVASEGRTRLFVYPPYTFRVVDGLLTNFHLPGSTLLMLVSAFVSPGSVDGRERLLSAYAEAVKLSYRFFSYGDAMLIL